MYSCYAKMGSIKRKQGGSGIPAGSLELTPYSGSTASDYTWTICSLTTLGSASPYGVGCQIGNLGKMIVCVRPTSTTSAFYYTNTDKTMLYKSANFPSYSVVNSCYMSKSASYVLVNGREINDKLLASSNLGASFNTLTTNTATLTYSDVALSSSGQYQLAVGYNYNTNLKPALSTNYGATWNIISALPNAQQNCCWVSDSGQNMIVLSIGNCRYSTDYGINWSAFTGVGNPTNVYASNDMSVVFLGAPGAFKYCLDFPNSGSPTWLGYAISTASQVGNRVSCSSNGNVAFFISTTDNKAYYTINRSSTLTGVHTTFPVYASHVFVSCDVSPNGQEILLVSTVGLHRITFVTAY